MSEFGKRFKELRLEKGYSLRDFCSKYGIDASNLSKMERGVLAPPSSEKLEQYLMGIGLEKSSDEWYTLHDLAAAERGQIPEYMVDDEFIQKRMPVFFRALRESKNCNDGKEVVNRIQDIIRKAWTS